MKSKNPVVDIDASIKFLAKADKRFAPVIKRVKRPELSKTGNAYRSLAESIIYQQLSGKAAATIAKRFKDLYKGTPYPKPAQVMKTPIEKLRSVGLSGQKASYLLDLSEKFLDGTIQPSVFHEMTDEDIAKHLIAVKGIGQWTADMFLIFALNRPNILPLGDLGIKKGFQVFFGLKKLPAESTMKRLAKPFDGHHTVFSLYLWRIADEKNTLRK